VLEQYPKERHPFSYQVSSLWKYEILAHFMCYLRIMIITLMANLVVVLHFEDVMEEMGL